MRHQPQKQNKIAGKMLKTAANRKDKDGLNTVDYKIVHLKLYTGFTHFLFDIGTKSKRVTK